MSRQERRATEKNAAKHFRSHGLSLGDRGVTLALLTRRLIRTLENRSDPSRATKVGRESQRVYDLSLRSQKSAFKIDCKKGCSYCCKKLVTATVPDVFAISRLITTRPAIEVEKELTRIYEAEDRTRGLDDGGRYESRLPCPLLRDDMCTVYLNRPLACRAWASTDVSACEQWLDDVPVPEFRLTFRSLVEHGVRASLKACGLPSRAYDLGHAVRIALEEPDAESRWLGGENVFHSVAIDESMSGEIARFSGELIAALIGAARGNAMDMLEFYGED